MIYRSAGVFSARILFAWLPRTGETRRTFVWSHLSFSFVQVPSATFFGATTRTCLLYTSRWRQANPRIKDMWFAMEQTALAVMQTAQPQATHGIIFALEGDLVYGQSFLTVKLPSGRKPVSYTHLTRLCRKQFSPKLRQGGAK